MTDTAFTRKHSALVNTDTNALKAAKIRQAHANRLKVIEEKIDKLQEQINSLLLIANKGEDNE